MTIPAKQVGWTVEANLLYQISKQLDHLIRLSCDCSTTFTTSTSSTSTSTTDTTSSTSTSSSTTSTTSTTISTTTTEIPGLRITFDDVANADLMVAGSASNVTDWNTFFDLPVNGTSFTGVTVLGNTVNLKGGSGITLKDSLFDNFYGFSLLSIVDNINCIVNAGYDCFGDDYFGCVNLNIVNLPSLITAGNSCFRGLINLINPDFSDLTTVGNNCFQACTGLISPNFSTLTTTGTNCFFGCTGLISPDFSALITAGSNCFYNCTSLTTLSLPSCTALGSTVGNNSVFFGIVGNTITLTIPSALMTCNDGITTFDPDGDIQTLQLNNTVTVIMV